MQTLRFHDWGKWNNSVETHQQWEDTVLLLQLFKMFGFLFLYFVKFETKIFKPNNQYLTIVDETLVPTDKPFLEICMPTR